MLQDCAGDAEIHFLPICLPPAPKHYPVLSVDWSFWDTFLGQLMSSGQEADRMLTGR